MWTGFQRRPCSGLLNALLLMDLRGQHYGAATGAGAHERIAPLYWVVGQYLAVSLLLCLLLFVRVDAAFFAFANLSAAALLVLSAIVVEFNEALFDPLDLEVVAHRPVSSVTYAAARGVNLMAYAVLLGLALTVFPATIGAAQRDAGPWFVPAYVAASLAVCLTTVGVAVIAYSWRGSREALERAKVGFAWVQIVLILVLFYGGQALLRSGSTSVAFLAAFPPAWVRWIPTWAPGEWVQATSRDPWNGSGVTVLGMVGAASFMTVAALVALSRLYSRVSRESSQRVIVIRSTRRGGTVCTGALAPFTRSRQSAAGGWLTGVFLRRDAELQMRSWPSLSVPAGAALLVVMTGTLGDPMRTADLDSLAVLGVVALLASALPVVIHNMYFARDFEAAWLFLSAPVDDSRLVDGVRRQTLTTVFLPFMGVYFGMLAWAWRSPVHAAAQFAAAWLTLEIVAWLVAPLVLAGPVFSRAPVMAASLGPVTVVSAATGTVAMALLLLQHASSRGLAALAAYTGILTLIRWALSSRLGRVLRRELALMGLV